MDDTDSEGGFVACDECGGAHNVSRIAGQDDVTCPRCGNDTFTEIYDPSTL
jgi:uncharacterized paraquat-inducible protein A